jgi:hypothetical protein
LQENLEEFGTFIWIYQIRKFKKEK